jgi:hypothetical protein
MGGIIANLDGAFSYVRGMIERDPNKRDYQSEYQWWSAVLPTSAKWVMENYYAKKLNPMSGRYSKKNKIGMVGLIPTYGTSFTANPIPHKTKMYGQFRRTESVDWIARMLGTVSLAERKALDTYFLRTVINGQAKDKEATLLDTIAWWRLNNRTSAIPEPLRDAVKELGIKDLRAKLWSRQSNMLRSAHEIHTEAVLKSPNASDAEKMQWMSTHERLQGGRADPSLLLDIQSNDAIMQTAQDYLRRTNQ